jgi:hypothetical protein
MIIDPVALRAAAPIIVVVVITFLMGAVPG